MFNISWLYQFFIFIYKYMYFFFFHLWTLYPLYFFTCWVGGPWDHPPVQWFIKRTQDLEKLLKFTVALYYSERIQIKITKEKRYMLWNLEEKRSKLPLVSFQWSWARRGLIFPVILYGNTKAYGQPDKLIWTSMSRAFFFFL